MFRYVGLVLLILALALLFVLMAWILSSIEEEEPSNPAPGYTEPTVKIKDTTSPEGTVVELPRTGGVVEQ